MMFVLPDAYSMPGHQECTEGGHCAEYLLPVELPRPWWRRLFAPFGRRAIVQHIKVKASTNCPAAPVDSPAQCVVIESTAPLKHLAPIVRHFWPQGGNIGHLVTKNYTVLLSSQNGVGIPPTPRGHYIGAMEQVKLRGGRTNG